MKITTSFFVFAILFSLAVPATVASAEELHPGASRDGVGLPAPRAAGAETPQHYFLIACWNCQHGQPGAAARATRCAASENVAKGFGWIGEGVETKSRDATLATHRLVSAAVDGWKVDAQHVDAQARSLGPGCARSRPEVRLGEIYDKVAQAPDFLRHPVIVIPGILGSRLVDDETGQVVWGKFERIGFLRRPVAVASVAMPMREDVPLADLQDSIRSDGTLAYLEIDVAGLPVEIQAYGEILKTLGVGGYRDPQRVAAGQVDYGREHFTCFQLDYDWRRDIAENAARLDRFIADSGTNCFVMLRSLYCQHQRRR